jgi:Glycosyltransferase family 9 (heptosyltransferase)/Tetratricopeptide repeat
MVKASEWFEAAVLAMELGDKRSAVHNLEQGLLLAPGNASAWANRGNLLHDLGQPFEALVSLDRALALAPGAPELYVNRGACLVSLNRLEGANTETETALRLDPACGLALANKGNYLYLAGSYDRAASLFAQALKRGTGVADANELRLFRAMALLAAGRFKEGWAEYEKRDQVELNRRHLPFPRWKGESGKSVLVTSEQGHGDAIQFMRYAPLLKTKHGGMVYLEVRRSLKRIAETMPGIDGVVAFGDGLPPVEMVVSMMSLPHYLGTDAEADIPDGSYLSGKGSRANVWRERLEQSLPGKFRVGLCWAGQSRKSDRRLVEIDARRSMALAQMAPLAHVPGVAFVSLQVGPERFQSLAPTNMQVLDLTAEVDDFYDTAALIECLDLVITVDTAVVHLAGALGKPVWLLSRFDTCWRWLGRRKDSPWYMALKQFRQPSWGNWSAVMDGVAHALKDRVAIRQVA